MNDLRNSDSYTKLQTQVVSMEHVPAADTDEGAAAPLVLIVDDEPIIVDTLSAILASAGFRTLRAYGGETGLELALSARPDLVLSDVFMPGLDGPALAVCVLAQHPCKFVLISGNATADNLLAARQAGYDIPLLRKPIHPVEIISHIRRFLGMPTAPQPSQPVPPNSVPASRSMLPGFSLQEAF